MMLALIVAAAQAAAPAPATSRDVPVAVLGRVVERGERVAASDFTVERRSPGQVQGALGAQEAAGLEATRRLQAGQVVRRGDLIAPQLVHRGDSVTITLRNGGLSITSAGRALSGGGIGERVRVVRLVTNTTLDAIVEGEGQVGLMTR
ncbi:flagellar basal body P-ring formation chaperone FlgA [Sphingomonas sp. M6A6_1c]